MRSSFAEPNRDLWTQKESLCIGWDIATPLAKTYLGRLNHVGVNLMSSDSPGVLFFEKYEGDIFTDSTLRQEVTVCRRVLKSAGLHISSTSSC